MAQGSTLFGCGEDSGRGSLSGLRAGSYAPELLSTANRPTFNRNRNSTKGLPPAKVEAPPKKKVGKYEGKVIGIVGAEAKKFLPDWELWARRRILENIQGAAKVVSGRCPLGGIDLWAIEEAEKIGIPTKEFPPETNNWEGFKARNILIAESSDIVLCIAVRKYHHRYRGRRFDLCYHCKTKDHVKSGGCWTMHYAKKLGKIGELIIVGV